jgi:GntR family transcriptional regulator/MocR family aminotransferase
LARRRSLLAWAERHDGAVIEDDYDSEFRFGDRPLEPLRTLDMAGRVIYVGSFSKTLLPALRLGFMIAPPSLRSAVQAAKFLSDWHSPTVLQLALAEFLETGGFGRHLRKLNVVYRERHQMLTTALATRFDAYLELMPSSTGLHVAGIARTASVDQIEAFARRAADAGVAIQTLSSFAAGEKALAGIVLGYGGIATADIEEGLRRLRKCFDR